MGVQHFKMNFFDLVHLGEKQINIPHTMDTHQEHFCVCSKVLNVVIFIKEYFVAIIPIF
jgi:hypothetical protein